MRDKDQRKCNISANNTPCRSILSKSKSSTTAQVVFFTIVLSILLVLMYDRWSVTNNDNEMFILQREMEEYTRRSTSSLEERIGRIGDISDSYQVSTGRRISIVEQELKTLQERLDILEEELRDLENNNNTRLE